jgi:hypothetical protein
MVHRLPPTGTCEVGGFEQCGKSSPAGAAIGSVRPKVGRNWDFRIGYIGFMDDPKSQPQRTRTDFQGIYAEGGFWSCCGYDGLSMVFDLPLEAVQSLPEDQKRALMRLLGHLAKGGDEALQGQMRELESLTAKERFTGLVHLSARFAA